VTGPGPFFHTKEDHPVCTAAFKGLNEWFNIEMLQDLFPVSIFESPAKGLPGSFGFPFLKIGRFLKFPYP